jgi:hypothetical protein
MTNNENNSELVNVNGYSTHTMNVWADNDAYVDLLSGMGVENHGNEGCLKVGREIGEWGYQAYTLLRFDLSDMPDDAVITQATLWMTPIGGRFARLELLRLLEDWDEDIVNWDTQPSTPTGPHIPNINDPQMFFWDVTALIQNWWIETYPNYGFKIIPYTSEYTYILSFHDRLDCEWTTWPRIEVTYEGSPPPDWDPPDVPPDTEIPSITLTIDPISPSPADVVHITANAADDVGLRWMKISISNPAMIEVWDTEILLGETPHSLSVDQPFPMGPHTVIAEVRDVYGKYNTISDSFDVSGSGTAPELNISTTPLEVWPEDGKFINISITASDPEGIRFLLIGVENGFFSPDSYPRHSEYIEYSTPYPTEVTYELTTLNSDVPHRFDPLSHSYTEIQCRAYVQDAEYLWSEIETSDVRVNRPYQWDYGLPYTNPSRNILPWQCMYDIFTEGECWGPGSLHWWKRIVAYETYGGPGENGVKYSANNGECVGMSCFSILYAAHETAIPNHYAHTGSDDYIRPEPFSPAWNCVQRTIERFHGAQYSDENIATFWPQLREQRYGSLDWEQLYLPFIDNQIPKIQEDIQLGRPGYISLKADRRYASAGHAVVPWYVEQLPSGVWRIHIYDPNRNSTSLFNESTHWTKIIRGTDEAGEPVMGRNARFNEYDEYELYPYIDINPLSYSFTFQPGNIWDGLIAYTPYDVAVKNDYDLPDGWEYWWVVG